MAGNLKQFKARALSRPSVRKAYDRFEEELSLLDEMLKARASAGLTQAEVADRVGTTQSAIARLESGSPSHSPSIAILLRYAKASGYRVKARFVRMRKASGRTERRE